MHEENLVSIHFSPTWLSFLLYCFSWGSSATLGVKWMCLLFETICKADLQVISTVSAAQAAKSTNTCLHQVISSWGENTVWSLKIVNCWLGYGIVYQRKVKFWSLACLYLVGGMKWKLLRTSSPEQGAAWSPVEISGPYWFWWWHPGSNSRLPPQSISSAVLSSIKKAPKWSLSHLVPNF